MNAGRPADPPDEQGYRVEVGQAGMRIDRFVKDRLPGLSRREIVFWIQEQGILCNGRPAKKGAILREGDWVELRIPSGSSASGVVPEPDLPLRILREDPAVVAVDKAPDIPTHPLHAGERGTVVNGLIALYPEMEGIVGLDDQDREAVLAALADGERLDPMMARKLRRASNRVEQIMRISQEPMSLETPVGTEEDSYLGDFIKDETMPEPDDAASKQLLREQIRAILPWARRVPAYPGIRHLAPPVPFTSPPGREHRRPTKPSNRTSLASFTGAPSAVELQRRGLMTKPHTFARRSLRTRWSSASGFCVLRYMRLSAAPNRMFHQDCVSRPKRNGQAASRTRVATNDRRASTRTRHHSTRPATTVGQDRSRMAVNPAVLPRPPAARSQIDQRVPQIVARTARPVTTSPAPTARESKTATAPLAASTKNTTSPAQRETLTIVFITPALPLPIRRRS